MSKTSRTYERGKFRFTVINRKTKSLYVRKAVIENGKQKQIWRICEPQTQGRVNEILTDIEAEILSGGVKEDIELAKMFLEVSNGKLEFADFKKRVKITP